MHKINHLTVWIWATFIKGVDTGNAARCIPTQSGPKQEVGIFHHSSLYEQILG